MMDQSISVVIPALDEGEHIGALIGAVRDALGEGYEILVVDDGSSDETASQAREAGAKVLTHSSCRGYGAALKTGIRNAAHEWIVTMDADGQHNPRDIARLVEKMEEGFDLVIGARDKASFQYSSRVPGKAFLHWFAQFLVGERPRDVNSGLRLFRRADILPYFSLLPNGFSFSTTTTLAMMKDAYRVGWVPIQAAPRQGRKSTVSVWRDGARTFLLIVRIAALFNPLKVFVPVSAVSFLMGLMYAFVDLVRKLNIPDGAVLLMVSGVIIFFFGILADQLASLRRRG